MTHSPRNPALQAGRDLVLLPRGAAQAYRIRAVELHLVPHLGCNSRCVFCAAGSPGRGTLTLGNLAAAVGGVLKRGHVIDAVISGCERGRPISRPSGYNIFGMSSEQKCEKKSWVRRITWTILVILVIYVGTYFVQSRIWLSEYQTALGPGAVYCTCYVPPRYAHTREGYGWHCFFAGLYEPLWRMDQKMGGPPPMCVTLGIGGGEKK